MASLTLCAAIISGGCTSSPRTHFYTLSNAIVPPAASVAPPADPTFYIEVLPVEIPAQVTRPQLVITTRPGRAEIKEQQRWLAPLNEEIRYVLSTSLATQLSTLDVYQTPHADNRPVYRVRLNVRHFESALNAEEGSHTLIDAIWSVQAVGLPQQPTFTTLAESTMTKETITPRYDAIVEGHRQAIERIAKEIANAIRAISNNATPSNPPAKI
ncbi:membrane integrity-associated transporter subunit PqiC [Mycoavidus sp. B2-EB]|uniref:PqiC family protein n=1 Tax=Mycoavidus sp. B2-EB TaxID=2651972 RepID=UPI001626C865|nr:PqiC family protein [Mycoavidus sp. B2-EB]